VNSEVTECAVKAINQNEANAILFLPSSDEFQFKDEIQLLYPSATINVIKLLKKEGISSGLIDGELDKFSIN